MAPVKTNSFECCMAKMAAMKNVLSPISEMMIMLREAIKPWRKGGWFALTVSFSFECCSASSLSGDSVLDVSLGALLWSAASSPTSPTAAGGF